MADKKYKVIVSDRAKRMLGAHIRFMAQVNKDAASTKKKEIITAIRALNHMPQRFPFFEEAYIPPNKYHKMFIEKWYLILYQIQDDTVYVEYIVECIKDDNWMIHYIKESGIGESKTSRIPDFFTFFNHLHLRSILYNKK